MKKTASLLLIICLLLALGACGNTKDTPSDPNPAPSEQVEPANDDSKAEEPTAPTYEPVYVLFTNDIHCAVENGLGFNGLSAMKQLMRDTGINTLLVDNGDAFQGELLGTLSKGEAVIKLMNNVGYDVATLGNHDFDFGMEQFMHLTELANFPFISANFVDSSGNTVFDRYKVFETGGHKIAFVGVSTPYSITTSTPSNFMNDEGEYIYGFCGDITGNAFYSAVQKAVDDARSEGADIVIALSHLGIAASSSPYTSGELIENTTGIDAVLDGHSHSVLEQELVKNKDGKQVILSSTGSKMENIGCLKISDTGIITSSLIDNSFPKELAKEVEEINAISGEVIATTSVDLCIIDPKTGERMVRSNETNLGDLCADAFRSVMGTDIAITNGGNVRSQIPAGNITYGDIINVSPFNNELCTAEVTGQQILDALELAVSNLPGERGGFLQVSGISYSVDLSIPSSVAIDENGMFVSVDGDRRIFDVMIGDNPLDSEATYSVASTTYILKESGDGFTMFSGCSILVDGGKLDNQVLIEYITEVLGGTIGEGYEDPYGDGRITIIS